MATKKAITENESYEIAASLIRVRYDENEREWPIVVETFVRFFRAHDPSFDHESFKESCRMSNRGRYRGTRKLP